MFKLGLTGGIATGKSTISNYLKNEKHLPVLDADETAHAIMEPGEPALTDIADTFGLDVIHSDGTLNRQKLGAIVFNDASKRTQLNQITHPRVFEKMQHTLTELEQQGAKIVVLDIPLLFESNQGMTYDAVCVVATDEANQLQRLMSRNQLNEDEARARMSAQMPLQQKINQADYVINNNGNLQDSYQQVDDMLTDIHKRNGGQ
ncbi:dephospho-CoA kinase [Weissella uvarum]|nr:dephospho-CoA kinase [Weissella uvarum]MCM0595639.1 dephospho-CoA kinase [Weissella uvarum]